MALPFLVYARESSGYTSLAPSRQEVTFALNQVPSRMAARGMAGVWAGTPRVTKWETVAGAWTHVASVYLLTGSAMPEGFRTALADEVRESLVANASHDPPLVPSTWRVQVDPFNEAENGPASWWESGQASTQAAWVDHWPPISDQIIPGAPSPVEDNHTGPNDLHRPPPATNPLGALTLLVGLTVAGVALIEFGPEIVAAMRSARTKTPATHAPVQNPRRRR